ncbi:MAG: helical backbone metal receptor [Ferruginibacter sp.]
MLLEKVNDLGYLPHRIISLVPSQTELLFHLGLKAQTIGITKFCIHPDTWFRSKILVGGTKNINHNTIARLQPDLIIANKEENTRHDVMALAENFPVWMTDVNDLNAAQEMITDVGFLTGRQDNARQLTQDISNAFAQISSNIKIPAAYLIWQEPFMAAGSDCFIDDMMKKAGFRNVFHPQARYPEVTLEDIRNAGAEILLLSSEPYPFREKHQAYFSEALPGVKVLLADGEMFSWYGSRLLQAPAYLEQLYLRALNSAV